MDHQGGLGQSSSNTNIQNGADPQEFPHRLLSSNFVPLQEVDNISTSDDHVARVSPHNLDLNESLVENVHQRQSVAGIGHSTIRSILNMQQFGEARHVSANIVPVSFEDGDVRGSSLRDDDLQHSSHARQTSNINSIHHRTAADPNSRFLMPNIFSLGQARNTLPHLSRQTPWYHQHENQPPYSPTPNSAGVIPYMQPIVPVSNSHETLQTSPMESLHGPRSIMLGPQTGRRFRPRNGTANFLGNFTSPSDYVSSSHISNAPTEVPGFNTRDQPILMLPRVGNVGNNRSQNRYRMVSRSWRQSAVRREPLRNNEARNTLVTEIRNALERLRNGELVRAEEFIILDYSLLVLLLEECHNQHLVAGNEENPLAFLGLNEDFVMLRLGRDRFRPSRIGDPGYAETCCICQENYVDGDDIGLLNCLHRFHVDCIKQWLVIKNCCPICKQIGLYV